MEPLQVVTSQSAYWKALVLAVTPSWIAGDNVSQPASSVQLCISCCARQPVAAFSTKVQIPWSFFNLAQPCACVLPRAWYILNPVPVPLSIECSIHPLVHKVRQSGSEIPVSDVWIRNDCLGAHRMCWTVGLVRKQTMQLGTIVVS